MFRESSSVSVRFDSLLGRYRPHCDSPESTSPQVLVATKLMKETLPTTRLDSISGVYLLERGPHIIMSPLSNVCMLPATNRKPMNLVHGAGYRCGAARKFLFMCFFFAAELDVDCPEHGEIVDLSTVITMNHRPRRSRRRVPPAIGDTPVRVRRIRARLNVIRVMPAPAQARETLETASNE